MSISSTDPPARHAKSDGVAFDGLPHAERMAIFAKLATRDENYGCGEDHDAHPTVPQMRDAIRRLELSLQRVEQARELITMPAEVVGIGWRFIDEPWLPRTVVGLLDHVEKCLTLMTDAARCEVTITSNDLDVVDGGDAIIQAVVGRRGAVDADLDRATSAISDFKTAMDLLGYESPLDGDDRGPTYDETESSTMRSLVTRIVMAKELQHRALDLIRQPSEGGEPGWRWCDDIVAAWFLTLGQSAEEQLDGLYSSALCALTSKTNDAALRAGGAA